MKTNVKQLAIFGGDPAFSEPLHVGRPNLGNRSSFLRRVDEMFDRKWLTNNGPLVQQFEREIAERAQVRHCVATCNATVALEILIRGMRFSGEVIVPSLTFVATAHALQWLNIKPVFCDVNSTDLTLDPVCLRQAITPKTTGIIGVHLWGRTCNCEEIERVAAEHGLGVIYDAAHAFGVSRNAKPVGSFGNAEVFSFHATKFLNAFEGGAIVTNDDELAQKARLMRNFGFADYDTVVDVGTNGKMTEISAAMGLTCLESYNDFVAVNRRNYREYLEVLRIVPELRLLEYNDSDAGNYQYVVVILDHSSPIKRDQLVEVLWKENILARRYFYPGCHRMEPYRTLYGEVDLPVTEDIVDRVIVLPTGTAVTQDDIREVCSILHLCFSGASELQSFNS